MSSYKYPKGITLSPYISGGGYKSYIQYVYALLITMNFWVILTLVGYRHGRNLIKS